jgi:hypothetical protein
MANVFVHFEPIGAVGQEVRMSSDIPSYVVPGKSVVDILRAAIGKYVTFANSCS